MKLAIMQPYFFPYIGYLQLISAVDKFIFYDDVNFIKKGWINRNHILMNNKKWMFTIPCIKVTQNKKINEIFVESKSKDIDKILITIKNSYNNAPYFFQVLPLIESIFSTINAQITISKLAITSIREVCDYLNIYSDFELSSKIYSETINYGKIERLIQIAKLNDAITYINPIGGMGLYDKEYFRSNGIKLRFIKSNEIIYKQFVNNFHPFLSIIDVLMFNSKEEIKNMLNKYKII